MNELHELTSLSGILHSDHALSLIIVLIGSVYFIGTILYRSIKR